MTSFQPSEIFEYFEEEPLGTASLAQVHKARLKKDGSLVAVKVQHALVKNNSKADMRAMEVFHVYLFSRANCWFPMINLVK